MTQPALCITSLHKTYDNGVMALKGVSLDVAPGDFFALQKNLPRANVYLTKDGLQQGRFAGTVRADDANEFALTSNQRAVVQNVYARQITGNQVFGFDYYVVHALSFLMLVAPRSES